MFLPLLGAAAQENPQVGDLLGGLLAPQSPALTALGVTAQEIVRPESPSALATTLLNGIDPNGNFQTGLAVDFSPYLLFAGRSLTLRDYKENTGKRQLSRFQTSLALTRGSTDDDEAARAALGLRWTAFDTGDPFLADSLQACFRKLRPAILPDVPPNPDPAVESALLERRMEELNEAIDECRVKETPHFDRSQSLQVTFAPTFFSESGQTDDFQSQGFAAATTYALGFRVLSPKLPSGQLILGVNYRNDEPVASEDLPQGTFDEQDRFGAGGRVVVGDPASWLLGLEATYEQVDSDDSGTNSYVRYAGSGDFRITGGLWLSLSVGGSSGREEEDELFALSQIKWNFGERAQLNPNALAVTASGR